MSGQRKLRAANVKSNALNDDENDIIFGVIGNRCVTLATAVVQVFLANSHNKQRWSRRCCGVACFIKDNSKRSYFIRVFDIKLAENEKDSEIDEIDESEQKQAIIWEQELYTQFKYKTPRQYFHTFEAYDAQAGLNFCNVEDANNFENVIEQKLNEKVARKTERRKNMADQQHDSASLPRSQINAPNHTMTLGEQDKNLANLKKPKKSVVKKGKKPALTKDDIGQPTGFVHVSHVGYDPNKGLDTMNLDHDMKTLFDAVGVGDVVDEETADFIYDYVEKHGGMEAVKKEIASRPPPPPPPEARTQSTPRRSAGLPPPPYVHERPGHLYHRSHPPHAPARAHLPRRAADPISHPSADLEARRCPTPTSPVIEQTVTTATSDGRST